MGVFHRNLPFLHAIFSSMSQEVQLRQAAITHMLSSDYLDGMPYSFDVEGVWGEVYKHDEVETYLAENFLDVWDEVQSRAEAYNNFSSETKDNLAKALARHVTNITSDPTDTSQVAHIAQQFLDRSANQLGISVNDVMKHANKTAVDYSAELDELACKAISHYSHTGGTYDQILARMERDSDFRFNSMRYDFSMREVLDHAIANADRLSKSDYFGGLHEEDRVRKVAQMTAIPDNMPNTENAWLDQTLG